MSKSAVVEVVDGHRQRSERSKCAIIEAGLSDNEDGILAPTALQISQRTGVGIRSFCHHFEDMETLLAAVDNYPHDSYAALFIGKNPEGSFKERLEHAIQRYAKAYKKLGKVILSSQVQSLRSDVVRKSFANSQRALRGDLDQWLPELKKDP